MLTRRQQQVFDFIAAELARTGGVAPSYAEIQKHVGLKAKSNVHNILNRLVARGVIRRLPARSRAIEIVRRNKGSTIGWLKWSDERKQLEPWGR